MDDGLLASKMGLIKDEKELINELSLLTLKPYLYIANISENGLNNPGSSEQQLRN
ncbi:MAG: hypothetical protein Ct9H300mP21_02350 [Pseudomonadota bacterium]|nr:MAG: hypothetical protein Ct9H300mP21_02350 [Pseudomonadota bacterium]